MYVRTSGTQFLVIKSMTRSWLDAAMKVWKTSALDSLSQPFMKQAVGCLCILQSTVLTLQNEIGSLLLMSRDRKRKENDLRGLKSQLKYHINNLKTLCAPKEAHLTGQGLLIRLSTHS